MAQQKISKNNNPHDENWGSLQLIIFLQQLQQHEPKTTGFTQQHKTKTQISTEILVRLKLYFH